ncbi:MAG: CoA pyrophosphatase [Gemmatimonadales bacterium]
MSSLLQLADRLAALKPRTVEDPARRQAAVAVILAPDPDRLLLIRRAEHALDPWSGQMGLPGGRREVSDADLVATALRETREELGFDLSGAPLAGALDDLAPTTPVLPPIIVRPYVFLLQQAPEAFSISGEVQYTRWAELEELSRPDIYRPYAFEHRGLRMSRPGYHLGDDVVWGMTERILTPLLRLLGARIPVISVDD